MFGLLAQAMLHDMTPEARAAAAAAAAAMPRSNSGLETMQSIEQVAGAVAAPAASPATRCPCLTLRVCRFTYIRPSGDGRQASPAATRRLYMPRQGQPFLVLKQRQTAERPARAHEAAASRSLLPFVLRRWTRWRPTSWTAWRPST